MLVIRFGKKMGDGQTDSRIIDKAEFLMTPSVGEVQTGTAPVTPALFELSDELRAHKQLFRMTLPHKNQSAQTCREARGLVRRISLHLGAPVCVDLVQSPASADDAGRGVL